MAIIPVLKKHKSRSSTIFVLRNNGLGDLLCSTPMFESIKIKHPDSNLILGISEWHEDLLKENPYVDEIVRINAPWHNQFTGTKNVFKILKYIFLSNEIKNLKEKSIDTAIDVLGSPWASLLFLNLKIPNRIGVKGYDGGYMGCTSYIHFDETRHITDASLECSKLIGCTPPSDKKPQIYLTQQELYYGKSTWAHNQIKKKIVIAPGGSFNEKCWPIKYYKQLIEKLDLENLQIIILGSQQDTDLGVILERNKESSLQNLCGKCTVRQSASIVANADLVISNASFMMHVSASFDIPNIVLLGGWFDSTKLHKIQWEHKYTISTGKETVIGKTEITPPSEVLGMVNSILKFNRSTDK